MKNLSKVVWSEGMYLATHHFQAQNRYFEDLIHFTISNLWFEPYGFLGYELDADALRNGTVSLVHARGIFPDGLVFHMPESDPLPPARNIEDLFPPTQQFLSVALAVPAYKPDGLNCSVSENGSEGSVRYVARPHSMPDENTGRDEKTLQLGSKNIRIHLETETSEEMTVLPLARITRDSSGRFVYDSGFVPPCLDFTANEKLVSSSVDWSRSWMKGVLRFRGRARKAGSFPPGFPRRMSPISGICTRSTPAWLRCGIFISRVAAIPSSSSWSFRDWPGHSPPSRRIHTRAPFLFTIIATWKSVSRSLRLTFALTWSRSSRRTAFPYRSSPLHATFTKARFGTRGAWIALAGFSASMPNWEKWI